VVDPTNRWLVGERMLCKIVRALLLLSSLLLLLVVVFAPVPGELPELLLLVECVHGASLL
jgi:hypothetical protein